MIQSAMSFRLICVYSNFRCDCCVVQRVP